MLDRIVWVVLAVAATAVLVTARVIPVDPVHGSSAHLGLPPCGFQQFTTYKCPGCGLTTCFAAMTRLDLVAAFEANAFGILLFAVTAAFVPFALFQAFRGARVSDVLARYQGERVAIGLALLALLNWLVRLGFEVASR